MKHHSIVVALCAVSLGLWGQRTLGETPASTGRDIDRIVGGMYFDVETGTFRPNGGIEIQHGKIRGLNVGALTDRDSAKGEVVELAPNQFLLPGFVDCHAHYNLRLIKRRREEFEFMPIVYLANGATATFSCGEFDPDGMQRLKERIEAGAQIGPRLLTSGPYFGRARPGWRNKSADEIREEVDYWAKKGVAGFKAKAIDPESLRVLIEQAHRHGLTVTGHLDSGYRNSVNPRDAIRMGIDRIEHFLGGDAMPPSQSAYASLQGIQSGTPEFRNITQHFVENGVFFDCTLTAYGYFGEISSETHEEYDYWIDERKFFTPHMRSIAESRKPQAGMEIYQRIYRAKLKTIADFHRSGGMITLGTDHVSDGNFLPGFGVHREMDALVRAGIPERDALRIATINGAKALGISDLHGSIAVGKIADLVIVEGNPLENIRHTRNVRQVVRSGKIYEAVELLALVEGKLGPANASEEQDW